MLRDSLFAACLEHQWICSVPDRRLACVTFAHKRPSLFLALDSRLIHL